jgi:predicted nucleic acid-binding protein
MIVLDSSAALAWTFADERTDAIIAVALRVRDHGAMVPMHWYLEMANILRLAGRKGRVSLAERTAILADFDALPLAADTETARQSWTTTLALADRHDLTVYDAAYLELALRQRLPLATLDRELAAAARREGVKVLP